MRNDAGRLICYPVCGAARIRSSERHDARDGVVLLLAASFRRRGSGDNQFPRPRQTQLLSKPSALVGSIYAERFFPWVNQNEFY
jgi:hypothetical protein